MLATMNTSQRRNFARSGAQPKRVLPWSEQGEHRNRSSDAGDSGLLATSFGFNSRPGLAPFAEAVMPKRPVAKLAGRVPRFLAQLFEGRAPTGWFQRLKAHA
jgi:hypothetical protein